ncbi:DoxX family protein [Actinacidiphila guanduensis]|uniref:Putative oxidoreductase n=1 Tax=Actinacidiphila guanduensis TaxID=310781 RepID=A0A1H0FKD5_9ACTN|nr:DoxX family protein [Actinacidiphila guanduensis]SDN94909.1 putative oxidoreductase [Actinacidiphila guanduensis]
MKPLDLERARPLVVGLFRIVVGLLFACHGAATLFGIFGGPEGGGPGPAAFAWPGWWASVIELVGGLLVMVGLGTRLAALACSGSMAYAYFDVHQRHSLLPIQNHGEPAVMFCWAFLLLAATGGGAFALESALRRPAGEGSLPEEPVASPVTVR